MKPSIIMLPIGELTPYAKNPRFNEASVDAVANSIRDFGFRSPIIADKDRVIIAGHTRYKAAIRLGLTEVPVIIAEDMTPEQVEAYRIADNSAGSRSTWDEDLLGDLLQGITYDMSQYGLEVPQIEDEEAEEDIRINAEGTERQGGTIRFNLSEPQVDIIKKALATVSGKGYEYGNMNSNGNKLTEICDRFKEVKI